MKSFATFVHSWKYLAICRLIRLKKFNVRSCNDFENFFFKLQNLEQYFLCIAPEWITQPERESGWDEFSNSMPAFKTIRSDACSNDKLLISSYWILQWFLFRYTLAYTHTLLIPHDAMSSGGCNSGNDSPIRKGGRFGVICHTSPIGFAVDRYGRRCNCVACHFTAVEQRYWICGMMIWHWKVVWRFTIFGSTKMVMIRVLKDSSKSFSSIPHRKNQYRENCHSM